MPLTPDDTETQIMRIQSLLEDLRAETSASREEARVISESMATHSRQVQGISAFKKRSAELRQSSSRSRTRR